LWKTIDRILSFAEMQVPGILLLLSVIVLFVNVLLRYFFRAATSWAEEAIRYTIVWITFLSCSLCARRGSHPGIDIVAEALSNKGKKKVLVFSQFVPAVFTALCTFFPGKFL